LDGFVEPLLDMTPETLRALAARLRAQARGIVETAEMAEKLAVLCEEYGAKTPRKLPPQILASVLEAGR
jgi:hypothetical protein